MKRANASERLVYRIPNRGAARPSRQRGDEAAFLRAAGRGPADFFNGGGVRVWGGLRASPERTHTGVMPHLDTCRDILRRLIAKGDINGIPLAERAINEYWDATLASARKSGLRLLQQDVLAQRDAVLGDRRNFADAVNAYIEKMLATE